MFLLEGTEMIWKWEEMVNHLSLILLKESNLSENFI